MLKLLKSKKALIIAALATILGWAGVQVNERDLTNIANVVLEEGEPVNEKTAEEVQDQKRQELQDQAPTPQGNAGAITGDFNKAAIISPQRRQHILYGDATGGGHLHGVGAPCKSEFPKHWDGETIIKEVELIASNDNLNWEQQRNGYYVTEQKIGTLNVRVVKGRQGREVITAYPTNVQRNPCPANDNF